MPLYMEMSQNINKTIRHLKFCIYIYIHQHTWMHTYKNITCTDQ